MVTDTWLYKAWLPLLLSFANSGELERKESAERLMSAFSFNARRVPLKELAASHSALNEWLGALTAKRFSAVVDDINEALEFLQVSGTCYIDTGEIAPAFKEHAPKGKKDILRIDRSKPVGHSKLRLSIMTGVVGSVNLYTAVAYCVAMLVDEPPLLRPQDEPWRFVGRCRRDSCGRFFMRNGLTGRGAPQQYCEGHALTVLERVRLSRAKRAGRSRSRSKL